MTFTCGAKIVQTILSQNMDGGTKYVPYLIVIFKTQILVQTILSREISMTKSSGINLKPQF